jgi:hypothetical protein
MRESTYFKTGHRWRHGWLAVAAAAVLGGCSAYDLRYSFDPKPVDVLAVKPGAPETEPVRTLVSVVGIRRKDSKAQRPASVEVRLRLENTSPFTVRFDPASLLLFSAGLEQFPDPILSLPAPTAISPAESVAVEALFPMPDGRYPSEIDLGGFNVRWTIDIDGQPVTSSVTFTRLPTAYYDRYHYRIGVGYHRYDR